MTDTPRYVPATHHLDLGDELFDRVKAASFPQAIVRYRNEREAATIGLSGLSDEEWCQHFAGFAPLEDNLNEPLALRYHGHQFRSYNPDLGDGRGFLFAQLRDGEGRLLDLGTKGSGQTPYSRSGDGRLTLKGGVREVLATEMLQALGVYTSKSFSLIETGEELERQDEPSPARSSVLVRLSHSHIRFGTFQYLAFHNRHEEMMALVDHCVTHYFPHLVKLEGDMRVLAFFGEVITRSANLVASWSAAGFVHGVLNTDNMNITGESFDYGPWRFLPVVDPNFTAAYFDHSGLYAYGRQAEAVAWNLAQLGGALLPLADEEMLNAALKSYAIAYEKAMAAHFSRRFGVKGMEVSFVGKWLQWMNETGVSFEQVLFDWFGGEASVARAAESPVKELYQKEDWKELQAILDGLETVGIERLEHDYFQQQKPCTMLIEEVESLWDQIADKDDWSVFEQKLEAINQMREAYQFAPAPVSSS
jgi:uncharacterized protein YdiU (UPF0061 family)